jgi:hypothetical protein
MSNVNRDSFQVSKVETAENGFSYEAGTVEVTLRNETRRVDALRFSDGMISARGMFGTYATSAKRWPAKIVSRANGMESVSFGRDDRSAKFNKLNNVWFEK